MLTQTLPRAPLMQTIDSVENNAGLSPHASQRGGSAGSAASVGAGGSGFSVSAEGEATLTPPPEPSAQLSGVVDSAAGEEAPGPGAAEAARPVEEGAAEGSGAGGPKRPGSKMLARFRKSLGGSGDKSGS